MGGLPASRIPSSPLFLPLIYHWVLHAPLPCRLSGPKPSPSPHPTSTSLPRPVPTASSRTLPSYLPRPGSSLGSLLSVSLLQGGLQGIEPRVTPSPALTLLLPSLTLIPVCPGQRRTSLGTWLLALSIPPPPSFSSSPSLLPNLGKPSPKGPS